MTIFEIVVPIIFISIGVIGALFLHRESHKIDQNKVFSER